MNRVIVMLCIAAFPLTHAAAQTPPDREVPVRFARGASSATVNGSVSAYETIGYKVAARAGQTMTLKLNVTGSSSTYFAVQEPEGDTILDGTIEGRDAKAKLPATGIYTIRVFNMRNDARRRVMARYNLMVAVR